MQKISKYNKLIELKSSAMHYLNKYKAYASKISVNFGKYTVKTALRIGNVMKENKSLTIIVGIASFILVVSLSLVMVGVKGSHESEINIAEKMQDKQKKQIVNEKLKGLEESLTSIRSMLEDQHQDISAVNGVTDQILMLQNNINSMKQDMQETRKASIEVQTSVNKSRMEVSKEVAQVHVQLNSLSKAVVPESFLPASTLPFKVAGLDFWNGKPMLSVAVKDINGSTHYRLMGEHMTYHCYQGSDNNGCRNWTLSSITVSPNIAIFQSGSGLKVRVIL